MGCFSLKIADDIAHITLDRPEALNSMTLEFWRELPVLVRDIDDGAKARVIVISSTGKHFTAGMDLSVFAGQTVTVKFTAVEDASLQTSFVLDDTAVTLS